MKVERKKVELDFEPITITLETREEAEEMMAIMNNNAIVNGKKSPLWSLFMALLEMNIPSFGDRWNNLCLRLKNNFSKSPYKE